MSKKLPTIGTRLSGLHHRLGQSAQDERGRDAQRRSRQQSKQWLNTKWWRDTRQRILLRDAYTCRRCQCLVAGKGEAFIDHIKPHRESGALFFCSDAGLQTLCATCHSKEKQREEQSEIKGVWY
jgi:5-methylcytosine-specific restriction endonuclease McrA